MLKAALAGTAALAIVGSSLVYAQERGRPGGFERGQPSERAQPNLDDMRAFTDARLAALHAGLGLTPDQEKSWPAFEQASREMAKLRLDRIATVNRDRQPQSSDPADRMHRRAAAMTETGTTLKKVADAMDPLYKSLDDNQKRRFAMLEHMLAPRDDGPQGREFRGRDGFDRGRDRFDRGRDGFDRGRDGGRDGERRFDARPRRTDLSPQGSEGGEQKL